MKIDENILIEVFRAKDQNLNENSRGVRITHKPSNLSVTKTEGVLQQNKKEALEELAELVDNLEN